MKIQYVAKKKFRRATLELIDRSNRIVQEYQRQGFSMTLRQLYYQLVARDIIPNSLREYKKLSATLNNARLAGLVSWRAIEDRTRPLRGNAHWSSPKEIAESTIENYKTDKWANQAYRPEVWIEKDALVGVIQRVCNRLDVDYFSCRGYVSASAMWRAGHNRARRAINGDQKPIIIHLGDHDPSGIDMTRDIKERMSMFAGKPVIVERIALNMNQIEAYQPPPNPAKITDSRAKDYIAEFGRSSWELDALEPRVIEQLIEKAILKRRNEAKWDTAVSLELEGKKQLEKLVAKL